MADVAADTTLPDPSPRLEAAFRAVEARMHELPFINPRLKIEAVGFAPWKSCWLGVMVTPWSMNLMLVARDPVAWRSLPPGEKRRYVFPAGNYDFVSATDPAIGDYFVCSLFSPMLDFLDHDTAVETARVARRALFDAAHADAPEPEQAPARSESHGPLAEIADRLHAPLSRRDLFHGRFDGGDR